MSDIKSIDEIFGLSDEEYRSYLVDLLQDEYAIYDIDELDDELLKVIDTHPEAVERICRINHTVFSELHDDDLRISLLAYNYNSLMAAVIRLNNIPEVKSIFRDGIAHCVDNKHYEAGYSISRNLFRLFSFNQLPLDEAPYFLAQVTEFYKALGKYQDIVEVLCAAASYFSEASAFQSAYRAIHDAQEIAVLHQLPRCQLQILETQGMVALVEGDLSCADSEFQKCFDFYKEINETPPFNLSANAALVKLRNDDYVSAKNIYKNLLDSMDEESDVTQFFLIKINLLICYRELDDKVAVDELSPQIERDLELCEIDDRVEARLILAKTYIHFQEISQVANNLKCACIEIQLLIDKYQRLHYRRGVREQYLRRIRPMLMSLEPSGSVDDVLHALVLCSSNTLLDWFSILEWTDLIQQSETVSNAIKEELSTNIEALIRFGTPFLYGFREKYDDPFELANGNISEKLGEHVTRNLDYSLPWREFNDLVTRICQAYGFPSPCEGATIQHGVGILNQRLATGTALLFSFACSNGCIFVFIMGERYFKTSIPIDNLWQFFRALYSYQRGETSRGTFHAELIHLQKSLEPTMNMVVDFLERNTISELLLLADHLTEGFPIVPSILASDQLRLRVKEFGFVIRTCPAIKEGLADFPVSGPALLISNSEERLKLAESELAQTKNAFSGQDCFEIDLQEEAVDFSKPSLNSAKHLHMVTHSIPANTFKDPFFISTSTDSTKNGVWLESVQREAHKQQFTLVVLNGCNTGTTSNWNYFKRFSTNEKVGLSSAFLLNRRCSVIATQWNEPENVGYIFSTIFYKRLIDQPMAVNAYALALVDLYELTKNDAIALLDKISDEKTRVDQCEALKRAQTEFPFRNPYFLGMFQFHSLLKVPVQL